MKTLILIPDGMGDLPVKDLNNKTPIQVSKTQNFNLLAEHSEIGLVKTIPDNVQPGSEIANAVIMGQDVIKNKLSRGALESISIGENLNNDEVAYRINLIFVNNRLELIDYAGGHPEEGLNKNILDYVSEKLDINNIRLVPGKSYRNILILKGNAEGITFPPHDNVGKKIENILPNANMEDEILKKLIYSSYDVMKKIEWKTNMLWPWGGGKKPDFVNQCKKFGIKGGMITGVDLLKGIGILSGMDVIEVPGSTAFIDTDYRAKAEYAVNAFKKGYDFIYLHIEAPDEASHMGSVEEKIKAIETIDDVVLGRILEYFKTSKQDYQILIMPDHLTPVETGAHSSLPAPYLLYKSTRIVNGYKKFDEETAKKSGNFIKDGRKLINKLFNKDME